MKLDYQQELEKEKTKAEEEKKSEILRIKIEFLGILQDRNDKLTKAEDENNLLKQNNKIISDERDILNAKVWNLENKQKKNAPIITTTVGVTCLGVGGTIGWWLRGRNKNPTLPVNINYGKNASTPVFPILPKWISQPDIHYLYSGVTPEINTSIPSLLEHSILLTEKNMILDMMRFQKNQTM